MAEIPYSRQDINDDDIAAVTEVLRSDFITQGPKVGKFEQALCDYCKVENAVVVSSGTAALHLCCAALGVCPSEQVWTTPISFVASANCGRYLGAQIDFVDIDRHSGLIDIAALKTKLERAKVKGCLPKCLVVVHFTGRVCRMKEISELTKVFGVKLIEDAAHALGAQYEDGSPVGNGAYSEATIFSFHPVKSITTAEGGAITTKSASIAEKVQILRSHGITRSKELMSPSSSEPWCYEQQLLGFHYRMTDIQAALGESQIKRLDKFIDKRRVLAQRYFDCLSSLAIALPEPCNQSAWHLYVIQVEPGQDKVERIELFEKLRESGIRTQVHYLPIHLQPYYRDQGFKEGDFPEAEAFYNRALSIPLYPGLSIKEQDRVIETLKQLLA